MFYIINEIYSKIVTSFEVIYNRMHFLNLLIKYIVAKIKLRDANSLEQKPATKRISRAILKRLLAPTCNLNRNFVYVNGGPLVHTL